MLDTVTWTVSGLAAVEAGIIVALVLTRRRHTEHGRRIGAGVWFAYRGRDVVDELLVDHPPDPVTPDE